MRIMIESHPKLGIIIIAEFKTYAVTFHFANPRHWSQGQTSCFPIPLFACIWQVHSDSINILLGHWYDSAKLHADQCGYPEGKVLGREVSEGQFSILSSEEAYKTFSKLIDGENKTPLKLF